jgi:hypothetical protein
MNLPGLTARESVAAGLAARLNITQEDALEAWEEFAAENFSPKQTIENEKLGYAFGWELGERVKADGWI